MYKGHVAHFKGKSYPKRGDNFLCDNFSEIGAISFYLRIQLVFRYVSSVHYVNVFLFNFFQKRQDGYDELPAYFLSYL